MSAKAVQKFFADNKADFPAGPYWAKDPEMVRNLKIAPVDSTYILLPYLNQANWRDAQRPLQL